MADVFTLQGSVIMRSQGFVAQMQQTLAQYRALASAAQSSSRTMGVSSRQAAQETSVSLTAMARSARSYADDLERAAQRSKRSYAEVASASEDAARRESRVMTMRSSQRRQELNEERNHAAEVGKLRRAIGVAGSTALKVGVIGGVAAIGRNATGSWSPLDWAKSAQKSWHEEFGKAKGLLQRALDFEVENTSKSLGATMRNSAERISKAVGVGWGAAVARGPDIRGWAVNVAQQIKLDSTMALSALKEASESASRRLTDFAGSTNFKRIGQSLAAGGIGMTTKAAGMAGGLLTPGKVLGGAPRDVLGKLGGSKLGDLTPGFGLGQMSPLERTMRNIGSVAGPAALAGAGYLGYKGFNAARDALGDNASLVGGIVKGQVKGRASSYVSGGLQSAGLPSWASGFAAKGIVGAGSATLGFAGSALKKSLGLANDEADQGEGKFRRFGQAVAAASAFAVWRGFDKGRELIHRLRKESTDAAQEIERVGLVLSKVGGGSGYTSEFLKEQIKELKRSGIQSDVAQSSLVDFIKQGIDLNGSVNVGGQQQSMIKALSRTAQNSAVVSGQGSSETLQRLIWGISTGQTDVVRTAGLNVSFESAYAKQAQALKKSAANLTEYEKAQARVQAVIQAGLPLQGAYEESLNNASKRLKSLERVIFDAKAALGDALNPAFNAAALIFEDWVKWMAKAIEIGSPLQTRIKGIATSVADMAIKLNEGLKGLRDKINLAGVFDKVKDGLSKALDLKSVFAGAMGAGAATFAGKLGGLFGAASPFTAWQAGIASALLSNADFRKSALETLMTIIDAAKQLGSAVAPVFVALNRVISENAGTIGDIAKALTGAVSGWLKYASVLGEVAAVGVSVAGKVLKPILDLLDHIANNKAVIGTIIAFWAAWKLTETPRHLLAIATGLKLIVGLAAKTGVGNFLPGLDKAQDALGNLQSKALKSMAAIGIVTVGIAAITVAWERVSEANSKARDEVKKTWETYADTNGVSAALDAVLAKQQQIAASADLANRQSQSFVERLGAGFANTFSKILPGDPFAGSGVVKSARTIEEMGNNWKAVGDLEKRATDNLENYNSQVRSTLNEVNRDAKVTSDVLKVTLSQAAGHVFDNLTASQQQQVEGMLQELQQSTASWAQGLTSFSGALLDREQHDQMRLDEYYANYGEKLKAFYADLNKLIVAGADASLVQEIAKEGPRVAAALEKYIGEASAKPGGLAGDLKKVNELRNGINNQVEGGNRAATNYIVSSGSGFKLDSTQKITEAMKQVSELNDKVVTYKKNEDETFKALMLNYDNAKRAPGVSMETIQKDFSDFRVARNEFKKVSDDVYATAEERQKAVTGLRETAAKLMGGIADPEQRKTITAIVDALEQTGELQKKVQGLQSDINQASPADIAKAQYQDAATTAGDLGKTAGQNWVTGQIAAIQQGAGDLKTAQDAAMKGNPVPSPTAYNADTNQRERSKDIGLREALEKALANARSEGQSGESKTFKYTSSLGGPAYQDFLRHQRENTAGLAGAQAPLIQQALQAVTPENKNAQLTGRMADVLANRQVLQGRVGVLQEELDHPSSRRMATPDAKAKIQSQLDQARSDLAATEAAFIRLVQTNSDVGPMKTVEEAEQAWIEFWSSGRGENQANRPSVGNATHAAAKAAIGIFTGAGNTVGGGIGAFNQDRAMYGPSIDKINAGGQRARFADYVQQRKDMEEQVGKDIAKIQRDADLERPRRVLELNRQMGRSIEDMERSQARAAQDRARQHYRAIEDMNRQHLRQLEDMDYQQAKARERMARDLRNPRVTDQLGLVGEALQRGTTGAVNSTIAKGGTRDVSIAAAGMLREATTQKGVAADTTRAKAIQGIVQALQSEAQAMVQSGQLGKDLGSITDYLNKRYAEEIALLPDLVKGVEGVRGSVLSLEQTLQAVSDLWDKTINRQMASVDSMNAAKSASYELARVMEDQRALLTNNLLTERDQFNIRKQGIDTLNQYVQALETEAQALARTGEIGQDQASIQAHVLDGLKQAKALYPELAGIIDRYLGATSGGGDAVGQAQGTIDAVKAQLNNLPQGVETVIQLKLADLASQQMQEKLDAMEDMARESQRQLEDLAWQEARAAEDAAIAAQQAMEDLQFNHARALQDMDQAVLDSIEARKLEVAKNLGDMHAALGAWAPVFQQAWEALWKFKPIEKSITISVTPNPLQGMSPDAAEAWAQAMPSGAVGAKVKVFDSGGYLPPGSHLVANKSGSPEPVFTAGQWGLLRPALEALASGGGGTQVNVENVNVRTDDPRGFFEEAQWAMVNGRPPGS